jgi:RNA polymerase sigma factor (TIGR02999 family)
MTPAHSFATRSTVAPRSRATLDRRSPCGRATIAPAPAQRRLAMERADEVTAILRSGADPQRLLPLVYDELRQIAAKRMAGERKDHTLQATALVHEAYVRLARDQDMDWQSRRHFYGAAAEAMRRVLVDHARKVNADKRGGDLERVTLGGAEVAADFDQEQILALSDALETLAAEDAQAAEVVRLRFLAGLSALETAEALGVSERTVHREWTFARARLFELLGD